MGELCSSNSEVPACEQGGCRRLGNWSGIFFVGMGEVRLQIKPSLDMSPNAAQGCLIMSQICLSRKCRVWNNTRGTEKNCLEPPYNDHRWDQCLGTSSPIYLLTSKLSVGFYTAVDHVGHKLIRSVLSSTF